MSDLPEILYEDNHIIAISKPAEILSQGDSSGRETLLEILKKYIKVKYNKPGNVFLGLVHRLDFPVTGTIVFARTSKAAKRLHSLFLNKKVQKFYLAIVPASAKSSGGWQQLTGYVVRNGDRTLIINSPTYDAREASLRFKEIAGNNRFSLLLIRLVTGRKHQIRAQLSNEGLPVAGDFHYGSKIPFSTGIALHAYYLQFKHPTREEIMTITAPIPDSFYSLLPEAVKTEKKIIDSIKEEIAR